MNKKRSMAEMLVYDSFDAMGLKEELVKAMKANGYKNPFPIQQRGIVPLAEGHDVILQAISAPGMKGTGNVPLSKVHDVNMQATYEPGKIATYCCAILNRLDFSVPKCQCLILTYHSGYSGEIVGQMQALGKQLSVEVQVEHCFMIYSNPSAVAHVAVGDSTAAFYNLLENKDFCSDHIKMVVFDWGIESIHYDNEMKMIDIIRRRVNRGGGTEVQFAVFSEKRLPEETLLELTEMLNNPRKILLENQDRWLTLEFIKRHQFISVDIDENDESEEFKVKAICEIINKKTLGQNSRIIIIVGTSTSTIRLTKKLKEHGVLEFSVTRCGMDQNARDETAKDFLDVSHVLITSKLLVHDMVGYFDRGPYLIVNYEPCFPDEYVQRLGWFREVDSAITLADPDQLDMLLDLQKSYDFVFERLVAPSESQGCFTVAAEMKSIIKFKQEKKHYIFFVGGEEWKDFELNDKLCDVLIASRGTKVIFVQSARLVSQLVEKMQEMFRSTPELVITSNVSEVIRMMKKGHPCVFVTSDDDVKKYDDAFVNEIKKNVHVVINYDVPSDEEEGYIHRFGWCNSNGGVIIHLVTDLDWFKVFDMQIKLSVRLAHLSSRGIFDHLKRIYPTTAHSAFKEDDYVVMQTHES